MGNLANVDQQDVPENSEDHDQAAVLRVEEGIADQEVQEPVVEADDHDGDVVAGNRLHEEHYAAEFTTPLLLQ